MVSKTEAQFSAGTMDMVWLLLSEVQECHAYPINKKLRLFLRMYRIGLDDPKYIPAKVFNDV